MEYGCIFQESLILSVNAILNRSKLSDSTDNSITIKRPSVFSDPTLSEADLALAEKAWNFKKKSLSSAARRGELRWSPGTEDIRIKQLQEAYRKRVSERYLRKYGKELETISKLNADHPVDMIVGGLANQRFKMIFDRVNKSVGSSLRQAGKRANLKRGDIISNIIFEE